MTGWIALAMVYVACILFFRWLGGLASAEEALRSWGGASSRRQRRSTSPSSSS